MNSLIYIHNMTYHLRFALATLLCLFILDFAKGQSVDSNFIDGWIYVKVKDTSGMDLTQYDQSNATLNQAIIGSQIDSMTRPFAKLNGSLDKTYRIHFRNYTGVEALITLFQKLPFVEYAEKAPLYRTSFTPGDLQGSQWALKKIEAEKAWDITKGKSSVVIAIVDNAVNIDHEDLAANIWVNSGELAGNGIDDDLNGFTDDVNGYDVADGDANPRPPSGLASSSPFTHGTLCAGIASAVSNNGVGIASLGYSVSIMAVKCSGDNAADEGRTIPGGYDGVYYAIRAGADVISLSWGGAGGIFITGENIVRAANQVGIVVLAAAGNSNSSEVFYPAGYSTVIAVGASDQNDKKASFSNYGTYLDIMAPGVSIQTTNSSSNTSYSSASGTSMSCPLTAALCGLILSQNSGLSPDEVKSTLLAGADNIDELNSGFTGKLGAGRINAFRSLNRSAGVQPMSHFETPNPIQKGQEFTIAGWKEGTEVLVMDLTGREVRIEKIDGKRGIYRFDEELISGFYLIRIFHEYHLTTLKTYIHD